MVECCSGAAMGDGARGCPVAIRQAWNAVDEAVFLSDRVIVLSERPGRVVREIDVPLPRPRTFRMVEGAQFGRTVASIIADLGIE